MAKRNKKSDTEIYCEIKEAFQIFDKDNDGIITLEEQDTIMRMLGINPNDKEQKENQENAEETVTNPNEAVEFNEFFDTIQHRLKDATKDEDILAENDGSVVCRLEDLQHEIKNSNEKISEEFNLKLLKDADPNHDDYIVYEDFIKAMLNR